MAGKKKALVIPILVGVVLCALHFVFGHYVTFATPQELEDSYQAFAQKGGTEELFTRLKAIDAKDLLQNHIRIRYGQKKYTAITDELAKVEAVEIFGKADHKITVQLRKAPSIVKLYELYQTLYKIQQSSAVKEAKVLVASFQKQLEAAKSLPFEIPTALRKMLTKEELQVLNALELLRQHMSLHYNKNKYVSYLALSDKEDDDSLFGDSSNALAIKMQKDGGFIQVYELYASLYQAQQAKTVEDAKPLLKSLFKNFEAVRFLAPERSLPNTIGAFFLGFLFLLLYMRSEQIYSKILLGMLAGAAFGHLFGPVVAEVIKPLGDVFIRMIKMVIVPLVFASLSLGVVSLGDIRKVGRIGGKTISYYLITTAFAISIGLLLANFIRPGDYFDQQQKDKFEKIYQQKVDAKISAGRQPVSEILVNTVPTNPIEAMTKGEMLQVIFFALFFGLVLATVAKEKRQVIENGLDGINDAMIKMVVWIMELAPIGVFALMAFTVAQSGASILKALGVYALVVLAGLIVQVLVVYGTAVRFFAKLRLWDFLTKMRPVQLLAFSTSSSAATLPVTMKCAEDEFGVSNEVSSFVLPLGATINMDGTALYQGVAAVFIAQVYGIPLDVPAQLTILMTATLASIGTAAVPGAGIVILAMVLESVGLPTAGIALIMGVDRILDMCRTTVNVTGDMSATLFVHGSESKRAS